jgi:uncharacterized membrane protein YfcA
VDIDLAIALGGLIVGFTVGLTGMGGGALMTPMLVLLFGTDPLAAVSSDLVASMVMKPVGSTVHLRRGTVHRGIVAWLVAGSVPAAFCGVLILQALGDGAGATIEVLLGAALLAASAAMIARGAIAPRDTDPSGDLLSVPVRRIATFAVGIVGGLVVGLTSVGSGSLMIVSMVALYPLLSTRVLVGTDLVQAVPLVASAAVGHMLFGDVRLGLTTSLLIGALPGVYVGARVSSQADDRWIRPILVAVLAATALKLLDVAIGVAVVGGLIAGGTAATTALAVQRRRRQAPATAPADAG